MTTVPWNATPKEIGSPRRRAAARAAAVTAAASSAWGGAAVLVPLAGIDGSASQVTAFDGTTIQLREKLGYLRLAAVGRSEHFYAER